MNEFELIDKLTLALGAQRHAVEGVGDDGAVLEVPPDRHLVVSTDTLVEGVHFETGTPAELIGYKSLAVNLSDLAAMGAEPAWYFLALTLPELEPAWVDQFAEGCRGLAEQSRIMLCGGDVTRGPLNITLTVCGLVPRGQALTRAGAQPGDLVAVSGPTGLAGRALQDLASGRTPPERCLQALHRPVPRLRFGRALTSVASSCIDVSDGLLADLGHVAGASGVGIRIELAKLPVPEELSDLPDEARWELQLGGGDDYELAFTISPERLGNFSEAASDQCRDVVVIGEVTAGEGCQCVRPDGAAFQPRQSGYVHGVKG